MNVKIIIVCGEWNKYKNYLLEKNVSIENLSFNYYSLLPKNGFLKYRLIYFHNILYLLNPTLFFI